MPHHKSSKKRLITNERRRERNRQVKVNARGALKAFRKLATSADHEAAVKELPAMYRLLDRQASKGVIPSERASRLKSRLAALVAAQS